LLLIAATSYCQNAATIFKHINKKDGLISNKITSLFIDSENYLWIGTQVGLQRYDGAHFKNFFSDISIDSALHSDWISDIFEDSQKRLWVGTDEGATYILNRKTNQFYNCNLRAKPQNKTNSLWHFAEDKKGNIWVAGHQGYYRYNEQTKRMDPVNSELGLKEGITTGSLTIDANNNFWLSTGEGIKYFDSKTKILSDKDHNSAQLAVFDIKETAGKMLIHKGKLWIPTGYNKALYAYDLKKDQVKKYTFSGNNQQNNALQTSDHFPGNIFSLYNGNLFIFLIGKGLAIYNPATDSFKKINAANENDIAYHANEMNGGSGFLVQDAYNNIITGNETGIQIFNNQAPVLRLYNKDFPSASVSSILRLAGGDMAFGFYGLAGGVAISDSNFLFKKRYALVPASMSEKNMTWALFNAGQTIWAPTQVKSTAQLNLQNNTITENTGFAGDNYINEIKKAVDGTIWAGSWNNGLLQINPKKNIVRSFAAFKNANAKISKRILSFVFDGDTIWATSNEGLQVFNTKTLTYTESYQHSETNAGTISSNMVFYVARLSEDTLLIGTNMGLNIFDTKRNKFVKLLAKDGLANNIVLGILTDKQGKIWVTCGNGGLSRIDRHDLSIYNYGEQDGLQETEFTGGLHLLPNGLALFGTSHGILSINTLAENSGVEGLSASITGLKIDGQEWPAYKYAGNKISLPYNQNDVQFSFASFNYWSSPELLYHYKIKELDDKWHIAGYKDVAIYNDLNNGQYTLLIRVANQAGVFSSVTTRFTIHIAAPFWKTLLFRVGLGLLLLGAVFFLFRQREQKLLAKQKKQLDFEREVGTQLRQKLELEKIINYFSSTLVDKTDDDEVVQDVARNLISHLDLEECMIYLWNSDKSRMHQRASFGLKKDDTITQQNNFDVAPGQGVVGYVMLHKQPVIIADTSADLRYRVDDKNRPSEITVPIMYNDEIIGVIDSEHSQKDFFGENHLQVLTTIASLIAHKLVAIAAGKQLQGAREEMLGKNEQLSKARLEALRSQMNPHFIFNSLNAIQECILTKKIDAAYSYLSQFSKLQRLVLENSTMEFIPLTAEIEMLNLYLSLESLRFHQSFNYNLEVDPEIDPEEIQLPTMLLQPYVENAIWHGLRNKEGNKILSVRITDEEKYLQIIIEDNGVGRKRAAEIKKAKLKYNNPVSKGTDITQQVMTILSHKYDAEIEWEVIDNYNNLKEATGTKVIIKLPMQIVLQKI